MPKRLLGAAATALALLAPAALADARPAPQMKAASTVDLDRDGRVDGVSISWSAKPKLKADARAPFAFRVPGYRVTRVERSLGRTLLVRVREGRDCDLGGSVAVRHGRRTLDMRRFDPRFPRITCALTRDRDRDGHVDGVRVTYSRAVRSRAQRRGRFLFSVAGYRIASVAAARGRWLDISLRERADFDSGAQPLVRYTRPRARGERRYAVRAGADAFTGTFKATRDGAPPRLLAARTGDADLDGLLDTVSARFSEPVRQSGPHGLSVLGMQPRSTTASAGGWLVLRLAEGSARGDARPGVWVSGAGVRDLAGNDALRGAVAPGDGAPPVLVAALTRDLGGAPGRIDALQVVFSEPVAHQRDADGSYPLTVGGRGIAAVEAASGRAVGVRLSEAGGADSGVRPSVSYRRGSGPVTDAAGNEAAEGALRSAFDGAPPVLLSGTTADADADGALDSLALTYSEDVVHGREPAPASFGASGLGVTSAEAAVGERIELKLAEPDGANGAARPAVSYRRDGVEDVRDGSGNLAADGGLAATADGAVPVLLSARTADADADGRIDRLATTWSEPLAHAEDATAPFPVSAAGFTVARIGAADGSSLAIDLVEPSAPDTGSAPDLSYTGGTEPLRDAAGLEPAKRSYAGLTLDALAPRLTGAVTGDGDGDGSLDSLTVSFSEAVAHARETAQASFAASGLTIASVESANGDSVELKLAESGSGDSGLRPSVSYTPDGQEDVRDASANLALGGTLAQASDGAAPVPLSAQTADADADGRLDRVETTWSEPLEHADDSAAPFPLSTEGFTVSRVQAASGTSLTVELEEPAAADTGSAPDLSYTGGTDPIRDAAGLEPAVSAHDGLTRDALAPRLVSTATADSDFDGRLDRVELEWSEQITGATASSPFTVSGRTLDASVSFSASRVRVPFSPVAAGSYDTDATPAVAYDSSPGDLRDLPEGTGDTAADAPSVAAQTPADKAVPVIVAAKTADLTTPSGGGTTSTPNGTIDAVLVSFSEPISHSIDGISPFSLNVAGRTETLVEGDSGANDRTLYVTVSESSSPDGGYKPAVAVTGSGATADRISDRAAPANEARVATFSGTADEVRPLLLAAQLGERGSSGGCTKTAVDGIDGKVDCLITSWSEPVKHDADTTAPFSLQPTGWSVDPAGIGQLGPDDELELMLTPGAGADRDQSGSIAYDEAVDTPVVDTATPANESLAGSKTADAACRDSGNEPNDTRTAGGVSTLIPTSPAFERKCAFDEDWYRVQASAAGYLELVARPVGGVDVDLELVDSTGAIVSASGGTAGAAGQLDEWSFNGLGAGAYYWARVSADDTPTPQEGPYCVVFSNDPATEASCGPLAGQLVFTEVGLDADKFVEIKNDFDVAVEMQGAGAKLKLGAGATLRECTIDLPSGDTIIDPGEHVIIQPAASATAFGCSQLSSLSPSGERLELSANGAIDIVPDLDTIISSSLASEHSLQFVEDELTADHSANDEIATRWCRTFATDSKGAAGDDCDEYRINEVLWRPTGSSATSDGRAFVELAGNLPAKASSGLLGGWVLRGVNGVTGEGTVDYVLPASASPRANGTYVVADGVGGATQVTDSDRIWDLLDLSSSSWPDATGIFGPRGVQLLRPNPPSVAPCTTSADAFGWTSTAQGFVKPLDDLRSCPGIEGQEYTNSTVGASAARDNLSSASDTSYNFATRDNGQNRGDFCPQAAPNPGELNVRIAC